MEQLISKAQGCLLGAAIGDALGMPTEYISKEQLQELYGGRVTSFAAPSLYHPCSHLKAGQYTDDTQRLTILAESLIAKRGVNEKDLGKRVGEWAHKCTTQRVYNRFAGGTSLQAGLELYAGKDPRTTGKARPTCGAAMGIAPLGVFYRRHLQDLAPATCRVASITHNHPAAIDSAVFIASLVAYLMNEISPDDAVEQANRHVNSELHSIVHTIQNQATKHPEEVAETIGASEHCYETVPMALHCFLHSSSDFEQTVLNAANLVPGDTDSIACIAGALSGAYNGLSAIPKKYVDNVEDSLLLQELGRKLLEAAP